MIFAGTFLYNGTGGTFAETGSMSKLPKTVVQIADRLLELDDNPRIIAQDPVGIYIRQYTGKIETLFGRDISLQHIDTPSNKAWKTNSILESNGDMQYVSQLMLDEGYDYLVYRDWSVEGFEIIDRIGEYGIFKPVGHPAVVMERNGLGQVVKTSLIDDNGIIRENEYGYSTEIIEYDKNGEVAFQYYYNKEGNQVDLGSGNLHDYLSSLVNKDVTVFFSAKDEATQGLTEAIISDLKGLGLKTNLKDCYRKSFYAVISPFGIQEAAGDKALSYSGNINGVVFTIESAAYQYGNNSSIKVGEIDYSKNLRGLNIVVFDNVSQSVIDSVNFDTFLPLIPFTR